LQLKDAETGLAEPDFAKLEVELPHAAEAVVVEGGGFGAVGLEAFVPGGKGGGVMQAPVLKVGQPEILLLDDRGEL